MENDLERKKLKNPTDEETNCKEQPEMLNW